MRIAATIGAFVFAMFVVGLIRMNMTGSGGAIIGLVQVGLFFGLPYLVWRAMAPKETQTQEVAPPKL